MRVLEEDIFSPPSQGASRKTPPSSGKTSLLPAADDNNDWEGLDGGYLFPLCLAKVLVGVGDVCI